MGVACPQVVSTGALKTHSLVAVPPIRCRDVEPMMNPTEMSRD